MKKEKDENGGRGKEGKVTEGRKNRRKRMEIKGTRKEKKSRII